MYSTTAFTNRAVELIDAHDTDTSMFMYLAHQAPHTPIQVNNNIFFVHSITVDNIIIQYQ